MTAADLRRQADIAPNTLTRMKKVQKVTMQVLERICKALDADFGESVEYYPANEVITDEHLDIILSTQGDEKMSDNNNSFTGAVQNLLYSHPLYDYINKNLVNILVLGYSDFTEKFVDYAFEMAQVNGYKLHITLASDVADAKIKYLNARPAFQNFLVLMTKLWKIIMVRYHLTQ